MESEDGLILGILLMIGGMVVLTIHGAAVDVYSTSTGSTYSFTTHVEYECGRWGKSVHCTTLSYLMSGAAYLMLFAGAIMFAVSIYRLIEPRRGMPALPPRGLCPKCGTMNPPTTKFCGECGTKLV